MRTTRNSSAGSRGPGRSLIGACLVAVVLFGSVRAAQAIDVRGFVYLEGDYQDINTKSPLNPDDIYELNKVQNFIRGTVTLKSPVGESATGVIKLEGQSYPVRFMSTPDFSDQQQNPNTQTRSQNNQINGTAESNDKIFLKEIYIDAHHKHFSVRAGKQYVKWGSSMFFFPIDVINYHRDPLRPLDEAEGNPMLNLSIPFESYLQLELIGVVRYGDTNKPQNVPGIAKLSFSHDRISGFYFAQVQSESRPVYGLNLEYAFSPVRDLSLTLYAQGLYKFDSSRSRVVPDDRETYVVRDMDRDGYFAGVAGGRAVYNFTETKWIDGIEFALEYYYDEDNWSRNDYERYCDYLDHVRTVDPANAKYHHYLALSYYRMFKNSRQYVYSLLSLQNVILTDLTLGIEYVHNIEDGSGLLVPGGAYRFDNGEAEFGARVFINWGGSTSEFGTLMQRIMGLAYIQKSF